MDIFIDCLIREKISVGLFFQLNKPKYFIINHRDILLCWVERTTQPTTMSKKDCYPADWYDGTMDRSSLKNGR